MQVFLEILKYTLPGALVVWVTYLMLSSYFKNQLNLKQLELQQQRLDSRLPLRLQAYERLVLFLERIAPGMLISRLRMDGMSAYDLQFAMITAIRAELEHNITQQVYVSDEVWIRIKAVTEEMISTINRIASDLPKEATAKDLSHRIFQYLAGTQDILPTDHVILSLKREMRELLD